MLSLRHNKFHLLASYFVLFALTRQFDTFILHYVKTNQTFQQLGLNQTAASEDIRNEGVVMRKCLYKVVEKGQIISHNDRISWHCRAWNIFLCWRLNHTLRQNSWVCQSWLLILSACFGVAIQPKKHCCSSASNLELSDLLLCSPSKNCHSSKYIVSSCPVVLDLNYVAFSSFGCSFAGVSYVSVGRIMGKQKPRFKTFMQQNVSKSL